jgi:hypothetical protein
MGARQEKADSNQVRGGCDGSGRILTRIFEVLGTIGCE